MDFFFQAEDGIRDRNVTGVQTCALPIWPILAASTSAFSILPSTGTVTRIPGVRSGMARSEERRVGKECRSWWWPCHLKKKKENERSRSDIITERRKKTMVYPFEEKH